jgi:hypothetical protein
VTATKTREPRPAPTGADERSDRLMALIRRVEAGDLTLLPALRKGLDDNPTLWRTNGDLALMASNRWVEAICGPNEVRRECLRRKMRELYRDLAGAGEVAPLERLLLDRVMCCWLAVNDAETTAASVEGKSFRETEFYEERLGRAQKRYLAAIRAVTQYRRLLNPAAVVQVNVAEKQINVAGAAG